MIESIIVTQHAGLVEWLKRKGIDAPVIDRATPKDVRGKRVYGVLPLRLAAIAKEVISVEMPGLPPAQARWKIDMDADEMDEFGAYMTEYHVNCRPYIIPTAAQQARAAALGRRDDDTIL